VNGPFLLAVVFLCVIGSLGVAGKVPVPLSALYFAASVITFAVYAWDKSAARNGRWRTRESTLHLLALVGGWPGALLARQLLRHKSSKKPFSLLLCCSVLLNVAMLLPVLFFRG
jgi:uncharacterized membrane protein YsdA (DUF1294 family)